MEGKAMESCIDAGINAGINEQWILEFISFNNRITAKQIAVSLPVSLRQCERIMTTLKEKGFTKRVGSKKSGHSEVIG